MRRNSGEWRKTHVRCRKCEARRALPRHPSQYVLQPRCRTPGCGARDYRPDKWMNQRNTSDFGKGSQGCACGGYWFKHRKGSLFCCLRTRRRKAFGSLVWLPRRQRQFKCEDEQHPAPALQLHGLILSIGLPYFVTNI